MDTGERQQVIPTGDFATTYFGSGHWDATGCVVPNRWTGGADEGWNWACPPYMQANHPALCLYWTRHQIIPSDVGGVPPPPDMLDIRRGLERDVRAGVVATLPAGTSLVNLPTCFWLEGATVPDEQWWQIVLASPPDWSGRQLYYVFQVHVYLREVRWNWGDGSDWRDTAEIATQCGDPGTRFGLAAHKYRRYPATGPDGTATFDASATLVYGLDVYEFWDDADGAHPPMRVTQGVPVDFTATTQPHPIPVVQEVGIPRA